ncbi:DUF2087 domain-containing protein [Arcanobacterium ihumii]|uniref:DUF2087 domain-containing protein n=1 Tax=Arcanobacterium ihumii TaxID=2138162 RepID=UPI000F52C658|nr:DUF2087 domain-containing protein [Arcanobacterium ihumii]
MTKQPTWQSFIAAAIGNDSSIALARVILGEAHSDCVPGLSGKKATKALEILRPYLQHDPDGTKLSLDREALLGLLNSSQNKQTDDASADISKFVSKDLKLREFPSRPKERHLVLQYFATRLFSPSENLHESQVNERLKVVTDDFVVLRRYLVDAELLIRKADGNSYQLNLPN